MSENFKAGIVIPVRNEQEKIVEAIESIALNNKTLPYFVLVDDASVDNTINNLKVLFERRHINGVIVENKVHQGAGAGRNAGIDNLPDVDFVLFFDADDRMCPGALDVLVNSAEQTGSDVVLGKYQYFSGEGVGIRRMVKDDELHWNNVLKGRRTASFHLSSYGEFLETVNYPWNKLLRFDFIKNIDLRFSNTPVHNDIFAHWQILMSAHQITLLDYVVCEHRVYKARDQITNISDDRRLALFNALADVENLFNRNLQWKKQYYHFFLRFKLDLAKWAYGRLESEYKHQFMEVFRNSLEDFDILSFFKAANYFSEVAADHAFIKFGMKEL